MITFGTIEGLYGIDLKNTIIFNLSSYMEGYSRLNILPTFICKPGTEQVFDNMYANYILGNDNIFYEFMRVMSAVYNGNDIYLLVSDSFDYVTESLQKFILARYGIVCNNIRCFEDWENVESSSFNITGVYNIDQDMERYIRLYIQYNGLKNYNQINDSLNGDGFQ